MTNDAASGRVNMQAGPSSPDLMSGHNMMIEDCRPRVPDSALRLTDNGMRTTDNGLRIACLLYFNVYPVADLIHGEPHAYGISPGIKADLSKRCIDIFCLQRF